MAPNDKPKVPYKPLLAALGDHIDEKGWRDVCILEVDGGMIVQGTGLISTREGYQQTMETKLLSHDELARMMQALKKG